MAKWYDDEKKVKAVFDCVSNYVFCSAIFYSGLYALINFTTSSIGFINIVNGFSGVSFIAVSIYLFYVNVRVTNKILFPQPRKTIVGSLLISLLSSTFIVLGINLIAQSGLTLLDKT